MATFEEIGQKSAGVLEQLKAKEQDLYKPFGGADEGGMFETWRESEVEQEAMFDPTQTYGGASEQSQIESFEEQRGGEQEKLQESLTKLRTQMQGLGLQNTPLARMKEQRLMRGFQRTMAPKRSALVSGVEAGREKWMGEEYGKVAEGGTVGQRFYDFLKGTGSSLTAEGRKKEIGDYGESVYKATSNIHLPFGLGAREGEYLPEKKGATLGKLFGGVSERSVGKEMWRQGLMKEGGARSYGQLANLARWTQGGSGPGEVEYFAENVADIGETGYGKGMETMWAAGFGKQRPRGTETFDMTGSAVVDPSQFLESGASMGAPPTMEDVKKKSSFLGGVTYGGLMKQYRGMGAGASSALSNPRGGPSINRGRY